MRAIYRLCRIEIWGKLIAIGCLLGLLLITVTSHVRAHSWYDYWCCSDNDCFPIKEIHNDPRGDYMIFNGSKYYFQDAISTRPSQDEQYHACIVGGRLRCLYVPTGT
jgi:hypothetical protein